MAARKRAADYAPITSDDTYIGYDQMPPIVAEVAEDCDDDIEEILKWGNAQTNVGEEEVLQSCFRKAWLAGANYALKYSNE